MIVFIYVIFGASGDLTKRKLVPALYSFFVQKLLPEKFALLGVSRTQITDDAFRDEMKAAIEEFREIDDTSGMDEFIRKIFYQPIQFDEDAILSGILDRVLNSSAGAADVREHDILPVNPAKPVRRDPAAPGCRRLECPGRWMETADH